MVKKEWTEVEGEIESLLSDSKFVTFFLGIISYKLQIKGLAVKLLHENFHSLKFKFMIIAISIPRIY